MLKQRLLIAASNKAGAPTLYNLYGTGGNYTGAMNGGGTANLLVFTRIGVSTDWMRAYASRGDLGNGTSDFTVSFLIKSDNTLWVAGSNNSGATGLGITTGNTTSYQKVDASTNWEKVCCCASDNSFTVAIKTDGTLWSWGSNNVAQLGNGGLTDHYTPVQIGTDTDWSDISCSGNGSAGDQFAMAVKSTGTLWGWGANKSGGNGQGVTVGVTLVPTQVGSATNWRSVSCGAGSGIAVAPTGASGFCLMVKTDGTLWGTGINANANINGSFTPYTSPVQIGTDTDWASAEAGGGVSLAIKTTGTLWSWGCDKGGTTGQNTAGNTLTTSPAQVGSSSLWSMVSLSYNSANQVGAAIGLRTDGTIWTWGCNLQYNLGNGSSSPTSINVPTQVGSATNWHWVSAGGPDGTSTGLFSLALSS